MLQMKLAASAKRADSTLAERPAVLQEITELYMTTVVGVRGRFLQSIAKPPPDFINAELERLGETWRVAKTMGSGYAILDL